VDQTTGCATGARTLAAGATCPLVVNFVGEVGQEGVTRERDLTVSAVGGTNADATTTLTGTTVMPARIQAVGYDNAAADFSRHINLGGVRIGYQSGDVTLTFKNTGSAATSALRYQWDGVPTANTQDGEFLIGNESTTCVGRTSLAPDATCTITVHFTPSSTAAAGPRGPKNFSLGADTGGIVRLFAFEAYALNPSSSAWIGISGLPADQRHGLERHARTRAQRYDQLHPGEHRG
jgi:hypothetical protein